MGTPTQTMLIQQAANDKLNNSRNTPIRPLTAAYKAATSDHEVGIYIIKRYSNGHYFAMYMFQYSQEFILKYKKHVEI